MFKCPICKTAFPEGTRHARAERAILGFLEGRSVENISTLEGYFSTGHYSVHQVEIILREELQRLRKGQSHKAFWKGKDGK